MKHYYLAGYKKAILFFISFFLISSLVSALLFFTIDDNDFFRGLSYTLELSDIIYSLIIITIILYFNKRNKNIGRVKLSFSTNYSLIFYILISTIIFKILVDPIFRLNEILDTTLILNDKKPIFNSLPQNILIFIDVVLLTPIIEEIIFRGYILKILEKKKLVPKILFTSFLFTLTHIPSDLNSLFVIFIFAILLGLISLRFGLIYSIIFHSLYNFIWFIMYIFSHKYWQLLESLKFNYIYWSVIVLSAIIFLLVIKKITTDNTNKI